MPFLTILTGSVLFLPFHYPLLLVNFITFNFSLIKIVKKMLDEKKTGNVNSGQLVLTLCEGQITCM